MQPHSKKNFFTIEAHDKSYSEKGRYIWQSRIDVYDDMLVTDFSKKDYKIMCFFHPSDFFTVYHISDVHLKHYELLSI